MKTKIFFLVLALCAGMCRAQVIITYAGNGVKGSAGDGGLAGDASFMGPNSLALDKNGNLYICDGLANKVRKIDPSGIITTYAGTGYSGCSGDGGLAIAAQFTGPNSIAVDTIGNLYIAAGGDNNIREVDTHGIIWTVAGNGGRTYSSDGLPATENGIFDPSGLYVDKNNNIYVCDNNGYCRRIDATGKIWTVGGNGTDSCSSDGQPATAAAIGWASGIVKDQAGNLFVENGDDNRIRLIDTANIIHTYAGYCPGGSETGGFSGDGGPATAAQFDIPEGMCIDKFHSVYVCDTRNQRVRKIDPDGSISTIAGSGPTGTWVGAYSGDGGLATDARLNVPSSVAVDSDGNIYIADAGNCVIRKIIAGGVASVPSIPGLSIQVFPNPATGIININGAPAGSTYQIRDVEGIIVQKGILTHNDNDVLLQLPAGIYVLEVTGKDGSGRAVRKIVKE